MPGVGPTMATTPDRLHWRPGMTDRTEGTLAVIAALLVLFSAMLNPRVSAGLAVLVLIGYAAYRFGSNRRV